MEGKGMEGGLDKGEKEMGKRMVENEEKKR